MSDLINTEPSAGEPADEAEEAVVRTVTDVGRRIREAREASGLTLRAISDATGVSTSMLSLVERGRTSPSIGTLVAICDALDIQMAKLFSGTDQNDAVLIPAESMVSHSVKGLTRRIILDDRPHGLELTEHVYSPGSASADAPTHHSGEEIGIVLEGRLRVEVNDTTYELGPGDAVHFSSSSPHRFENRARRATRAIWLNIHPK
ncbi:MAG TPA: XRE family transcriptional regulator [Solirubrobacteraceae bacterium]|nr:XRE family transcriptional regulator [Solirubrobacteraceae bacterium]